MNHVPARGSSAALEDDEAEEEGRLDTVLEAHSDDDPAASTKPRPQRLRILPKRRPSGRGDQQRDAGESHEGRAATEPPAEPAAEWLVRMLESSVRRALQDHADLRLKVDLPAPDCVLVTIESDLTSTLIRVAMRGRRPDDLTLRIWAEDQGKRIGKSYTRSRASSTDLVEMLRQGAQALRHRPDRAHG